MATVLSNSSSNDDIDCDFNLNHNLFKKSSSSLSNHSKKVMKSSSEFLKDTQILLLKKYYFRIQINPSNQKKPKNIVHSIGVKQSSSSESLASRSKNHRIKSGDCINEKNRGHNSYYYCSHYNKIIFSILLVALVFADNLSMAPAEICRKLMAGSTGSEVFECPRLFVDPKTKSWCCGTNTLRPRCCDWAERQKETALGPSKGLFPNYDYADAHLVIVFVFVSILICLLYLLCVKMRLCCRENFEENERSSSITNSSVPRLPTSYNRRCLLDQCSPQMLDLLRDSTDGIIEPPPSYLEACRDDGIVHIAPIQSNNDDDGSPIQAGDGNQQQQPQLQQSQLPPVPLEYVEQPPYNPDYVKAK